MTGLQASVLTLMRAKALKRSTATTPAGGAADVGGGGADDVREEDMGVASRPGVSTPDSNEGVRFLLRHLLQALVVPKHVKPHLRDKMYTVRNALTFVRLSTRALKRRSIPPASAILTAFTTALEKLKDSVEELAAQAVTDSLELGEFDDASTVASTDDVVAAAESALAGSVSSPPRPGIAGAIPTPVPVPVSGFSTAAQTAVQCRVPVLRSLNHLQLEPQALDRVLRIALGDFFELHEHEHELELEQGVGQVATRSGSRLSYSRSPSHSHVAAVRRPLVEEAQRMQLLLAALELTRATKARSAVLSLALVAEIRHCWTQAVGADGAGLTATTTTVKTVTATTAKAATVAATQRARRHVNALLCVLEEVGRATVDVVAALVAVMGTGDTTETGPRPLFGLDVVRASRGGSVAAAGIRGDPQVGVGNASEPSAAGSVQDELGCGLSGDDLHYALLHVVEVLPVVGEPELLLLCEALGEEGLAPFVCLPILNYFRAKRKMKAVWVPSRSVKKALEGAMKRRPQNIEAATVMKELLIGKQDGEHRSTDTDEDQFRSFVALDESHAVSDRALDLSVRVEDIGGGGGGGGDPSVRVQLKVRRDATSCELVWRLSDALKLPSRRYTLEVLDPGNFHRPLFHSPRREERGAKVVPRGTAGGDSSLRRCSTHATGGMKQAGGEQALGRSWDVDAIPDKAQLVLRPFLFQSRSVLLPKLSVLKPHHHRRSSSVKNPHSGASVESLLQTHFGNTKAKTKTDNVADNVRKEEQRSVQLSPPPDSAVDPVPASGGSHTDRSASPQPSADPEAEAAVSPSKAKEEVFSQFGDAGSGVDMDSSSNAAERFPIHALLRSGGSALGRGELRDAVEALDMPPAAALKEADAQGCLPLHVAVESGCSVEVVQVLLGIHPDAARALNLEGRLPFHLASGRPAVALELMLAYPEGSELPDPILGPSSVTSGREVSSRGGRQSGRASLMASRPALSKIPIKRENTLPSNVGRVVETSSPTEGKFHFFKKKL